MAIVLAVGSVVLLLWFLYKVFDWSATPSAHSSFEATWEDEQRHFFLHVVGVSHRNPDHSSRQQILQDCTVGDELKLIRDPSNHFDSNAIMVCTRGEEQIGFVDREHAERLSQDLDRGIQMRAHVNSIGLAHDEKHWGMTIRVGVLKGT